MPWDLSAISNASRSSTRYLTSISRTHCPPCSPARKPRRTRSRQATRPADRAGSATGAAWLSGCLTGPASFSAGLGSQSDVLADLCLNPRRALAAGGRQRWSFHGDDPAGHAAARLGERGMSEECLRGGRGDWVGCGQGRRWGQVEAHRESGMIGELFVPGLMQVAARSDPVAQGAGAEDVVVSIAVASPADPAVLGVVWVQVAERVDQAMCVGQGAVEVILKRGEEGIARLVAR